MYSFVIFTFFFSVTFFFFIFFWSCLLSRFTHLLILQLIHSLVLTTLSFFFVPLSRSLVPTIRWIIYEWHLETSRIDHVRETWRLLDVWYISIPINLIELFTKRKMINFLVTFLRILSIEMFLIMTDWFLCNVPQYIFIYVLKILIYWNFLLIYLKEIFF